MSRYTYSVRKEQDGQHVRLHLVETDATMNSMEIVDHQYKFNTRVIATRTIRKVRDTIEVSTVIAGGCVELGIDNLFEDLLDQVGADKK